MSRRSKPLRSWSATSSARKRRGARPHRRACRRRRSIRTTPSSPTCAAKFSRTATRSALRQKRCAASASAAPATRRTSAARSSPVWTPSPSASAATTPPNQTPNKRQSLRARAFSLSTRQGEGSGFFAFPERS
nr:MAG TPA: hypothetical protein [Caudoviricetes sp.]